MKKKKTKLLLGAVSLCILGGAYAILRYGNGQAQLAAQDDQYDTILEVEEQEVSSLSFRVGGDTLTFLRDEDSWRLEADDAFPVNADALSELLSCLSPLQAVRTLENVEDTSDYGLSDPQNELAITDESGQETRVTIGATNESTGDDYLILNGDETVVYTVSDSLRAAISDDLFDYAQSEELPSLLTNDVSGLSLADPFGEVLYELTLDREEDRWSVAAADGTAETGEEETIEEALSSFTSSLYYLGFLEYNCSDWEAYGLDAPQTLTVTYRSSSASYPLDTASADQEGSEGEESREDGTEEDTEETAEKSQDEELLTLTLYIGDTDEYGNYYVRQGDSTQVHTISSYALEDLLTAQPQDWVAAEEEETEVETLEASPEE